MFNYFRKKFLFRRLLKIDPEDIPKFSFDGITTYARVVKVYDGDTVTIVFEHKNEMIKYSCRLFGIDTPEIRTKDLEEKKKGYAARDYLHSYINDQIVKINLLKFDKYGRLLANLFVNIGGTYHDVSRLMINEGHAKAYFGGTK